MQVGHREIWHYEDWRLESSRPGDPLPRNRPPVSRLPENWHFEGLGAESRHSGGLPEKSLEGRKMRVLGPGVGYDLEGRQIRGPDCVSNPDGYVTREPDPRQKAYPQRPNGVS